LITLRLSRPSTLISLKTIFTRCLKRLRIGGQPITVIDCPQMIRMAWHGAGTYRIVFISGAAGAVGNMAGQLAKLRGCRVIGSTGSQEKIKFLQEECGFDAAFNYKVSPILEQLTLAAPDGIDVYFDNVGGEALEAALSALRIHGRIIACGGISGYNKEKPQPGPSNLFNITTKRLTMKGLIVVDWLDRQDEFEQEVGGYFRAGKLKDKETLVTGIDHAVDAFIGLFQGKNLGKMVVKLD
jgi:NADPH-dependent curcumin reductase CurA